MSLEPEFLKPWAPIPCQKRLLPEALDELWANYVYQANLTLNKLRACAEQTGLHLMRPKVEIVEIKSLASNKGLM